MLLLKTSDQLGNQMFAYAAVKTLAMDKGYGFGVLPKSMEGELCNDQDGVYGNTIDTIFPCVKKDIYSGEMPDMLHFQEVTDINSTSAVDANTFQVADGTLMEGHYIAAGYFLHRISEVRCWYAFPETVVQEAEQSLSELRRKHLGAKLVSVHFRVGDDYRRRGYLLDHTYWKRAAEAMQELLGQKDLLYLVFYDKKEAIVSEFMEQHPCVDMRKTLVYDLCTMSRCDAHIVCNSSFSMMTGLLDEKEGCVVCPSSFPIPEGYMPADCYPESWTKVTAGHDSAAYHEYEKWLRTYRLKQRIKKLIGKARK